MPPAAPAEEARWGRDDRPAGSDAPVGRASRRMRRPLRRALAVTGVSVLLVAGCSGTTPGPPSGGPRQLVDVPAEELRITGATGSPIDRVARNAIADLETFWSEAFPRFYGTDFPPLAGGYFSVDGSAP